MEALSDRLFHLAEGPLWNVREQAIYWTDILNGEIWSSGERDPSPRPRWKTDGVIGGFAFTGEGGLVVCTGRWVILLPPSFDLSTPGKIIWRVSMDPGERFNDMITDVKGRLFAGTKSGNGRNGRLFCFEKGCAPRVLLDGLGISNGMAFTRDHEHFFHTDSPPCTITRYRYAPGDGSISHPELFYRGTGEQGYPDGITLDAAGNLWVAFWGASVVRKFSPGGTLLEEIGVPALQPSSLTFGGRRLDRLYITSACEGASNLAEGTDRAGNFLGGKVYWHEPGEKGVAEWLAEPG